MSKHKHFDDFPAGRERYKMVHSLERARREAASARRNGDRGMKKKAKVLLSTFREDMSF